MAGGTPDKSPFPNRGGRMRMVPIGPKKGGGFIKVPLNFGVGSNAKSKLFDDKSGSLPIEPLLTKDVRVWRTEPPTITTTDTPIMYENALS